LQGACSSSRLARYQTSFDFVAARNAVATLVFGLANLRPTLPRNERHSSTQRAARVRVVDQVLAGFPS
jgi:hypothetical protein